MEQQPELTYSHTADYDFIDIALKARWTPFSELAAEFEAFVPKTVADFAEYRENELVRLQKLNPNSSQESLLALIDGQIRTNAEPGIQLWLKFSDRIMAEYVTVALLAHALAESSINAILAIGLASAGAEADFALLERTDIKEKWLSGPKAFSPAYSLPKSSALYQTLQHLTRQRNAFVHYKVELEMGGEKKLEGSRLDRAPLHTQIAWIRRFFSLPYDLASHARSKLNRVAPFILFDSRPIQRFAPHTAT